MRGECVLTAKSGRLSVFCAAQKILFDAIKELDSNFAVVGTSGSEKHSVNNFASQEFTIAEPVDTNYDGVDCHKIAFESTLNQNSKLTVNTYIFNAAGNITNGDEDNLVDAGNVKFTISVKDWNWCDASATQGDVNYCKKGGTVQAGEWLDFDLTMSTKTKPVRNTSDDAPSARRLNGPGPGPGPRGDQTKRPKSKVGGRRKPERFQVGGGVNIDFSTKVQVDGVWEDMYEGYPKMVATPAKTTFTFRFPKSSNIFYDPTIVLAETDEEISAAGTSTSSMVVTALAAVAVAAAARIED